MPPGEGLADNALFTGRLGALRVAYGAALPDQLGLLRSAARGLGVDCAGPEARATLEELRAAAHKFAGSAPTFGFVQVGTRARALERQIGAVLAAAGGPTRDDALAIQEGIEALIGDARLAPLPSSAGAETLILVADAVGACAPLAVRLATAGYAVVPIDAGTDPAMALAGCKPVAILVQADHWSEGKRALLARVRGVADAAISAGTPVVFMAGRDDFVARYAASQAGAVGFLADPLRMNDLSARLAPLIAPAALQQPYRVLYVGMQAPALDPMMFHLQTETDPAALLIRLETGLPELVLLSTELDGFDAADLARVIWQEEAYRDVGIFFLSRDPSVHRAVAARGVTDAYFITRPADAVALQGRITPYLHDRRAGLRVSNYVDLGPQLARLAGHVGRGQLGLSPMGSRAADGAWAAGATAARPRRKVLIVDDDRYLVAMLAHALAESGAEVVRAYSGDQGYAAAWQELPSAIISDVEMPNGTGDRMIQQLRANPRTRDIPVIVMTNRRWEDGKDYALEREMRGRLGAAAYLQKPVRPEHLVRELARL